MLQCVIMRKNQVSGGPGGRGKRSVRSGGMVNTFFSAVCDPSCTTFVAPPLDRDVERSTLLKDFIPKLQLNNPVVAEPMATFQRGKRVVLEDEVKSGFVGERLRAVKHPHPRMLKSYKRALRQRAFETERPQLGAINPGGPAYGCLLWWNWGTTEFFSSAIGDEETVPTPNVAYCPLTDADQFMLLVTESPYTVGMPKYGACTETIFGTNSANYALSAWTSNWRCFAADITVASTVEVSTDTTQQYCKSFVCGEVTANDLLEVWDNAGSGLDANNSVRVLLLGAPESYETANKDGIRIRYMTAQDQTQSDLVGIEQAMNTLTNELRFPAIMVRFNLPVDPGQAMPFQLSATWHAQGSLKANSPIQMPNVRASLNWPTLQQVLTKLEEYLPASTTAFGQMVPTVRLLDMIQTGFQFVKGAQNYRKQRKKQRNYRVRKIDNQIARGKNVGGNPLRRRRNRKARGGGARRSNRGKWGGRGGLPGRGADRIYEVVS